ncbi:sulfite exporter TauE/SafE family protein [bacterium]|nr:sulfite exporter TauE/SafE family protein [bacterium]
MQFVWIILLGLTAGIFSGLLGIGGGIILVPALIYIFKFSQTQAQGTTLAMMIPPIGLLAVMEYYKQGQINWKAAAFLCAGFFFGGLIGAKICLLLPKGLLQKIFGMVLLLVGAKMFFGK